MTWIDCGDYWHYEVEQGAKAWLEIRKGRCTGTNNGYSSFKESKEEIALLIVGIKEKHFTDKQTEYMNYGKDNEKVVRKWYEKKFNKKVTEMGFCIMKDKLFIGVSVDGVIEKEDGIIEIKCPQKMYDPIISYLKNKDKNKNEIKNNNYKHIWKSHYIQMQLGMAVLKKKYCDYVVYSKDGTYYVERIPFNTVFWEKRLKKIEDFWSEYVYPLIKNSIYPINPPKK